MEENTNTPRPNVTSPNVTSTPIQTPPPSAPPKKSKLPIIIIAIIIFFLLTGTTLGAYLYKSMSSKPTSTHAPITKVLTPTPTTTQSTDASNWKTYAGNGFQFKYPAGWEDPQKSDLNGEESLYFNFNKRIELTVSVTNQSFNALKAMLNYHDQNVTYTSDITQETLEGKQIIKAITTSSSKAEDKGLFGEEGKNYRVLIPLGSKTIFISSNLAHKTALDQILSTFKFTDTISPQPTISSKSKISYSIPVGWNKESETDSTIILSKTTNGKGEGGTVQQIKGTITIYSQQIPAGTSLSDWLKTRYLRGDENLFSITKTSQKNTKVVGLDAISIEMPGAGGYNDEGTVFIKEGVGYDISLTGANIDNSQIDYQQVLTSLKFTN